MTEPLTPETLKRLRELEKAAVQAPWRIYELPDLEHGGGCVGIEAPHETDELRASITHGHSSTGKFGPINRTNNELIIALRNAAPALLDAEERGFVNLYNLSEQYAVVQEQAERLAEALQKLVDIHPPGQAWEQGKAALAAYRKEQHRQS